MQDLAARAWFLLSLGLGRLLRSARYSRVRIVQEDGRLQVRKHRVLHAPLLVWLGHPLVRIMDTGVKVLPQSGWEEREDRMYRNLYGASIRVETGGTLVLPCYAGITLAALLEDRELVPPVRMNAIELAVVALAGLHRRRLTHGDAMAENVLIDLDAGVARWFDFETVHDPHRPIAWRRADDVRALLATCVHRARAGELATILQLILDVYADEEVTALLHASFSSTLRRPLAFHLGQAALSFDQYREVARLLRERAD